MSEAVDGAVVPTYSIPPERIVSIEHPSIIRNFSNGLRSLGGEPGLTHALNHEAGETKDAEAKDAVEPLVGVSLRPHDPFAKKLASTAASTGNVLLKVTLPARTGRKRRRGSNGPYEEARDGQYVTPTALSATSLLQRMRDNSNTYRISAVGLVTDTHRFTTLPDFQMRAEDFPVLENLSTTMHNPTYDGLKAFRPPKNPKDILPPPNFIPPPRQHVVHHEEAPSKPKMSERKAATLQFYASGPPPQLRDLTVPHTSAKMPANPPAGLTALEPGDNIHTIVQKLTAELQKRPIMTRRTYWILLAGHRDPNVRRALPYVVYYLDGGPWRFSVIKYGVDPRTDPSLRTYQSVSFSHASFAPVKEGPDYGQPPKDVRTFDGTIVVDPTDAWTLRDFTHPILADLVHNSPVQAQFNPEYGWYFPATLSKIVVLIRDMWIQLANLDRTPQLTDEHWRIIAAIPAAATSSRDCRLDLFNLGKKYDEDTVQHLRKLAEAVGDEIEKKSVLGPRGYEVEPYLGPRSRERAKGKGKAKARAKRKAGDDDDGEYVGEDGDGAETRGEVVEEDAPGEPVDEEGNMAD